MDERIVLGCRSMRILNSAREETIKAVRSGEVSICVVGLGHIGLPLAVLIAGEGGRVVGCDKTEDYVDRINRGETSFLDYDASALLKAGAEMVDDSCPSCGVRLFRMGDEVFCPYCGRLAILTGLGVHLENKVATSHLLITEKSQSLEGQLRKALDAGFHATTGTTDAVRGSDVVIITVGTPIDENNVPDYTGLREVSHDIARGLQEDVLVIVKSTVSPGTTENLVKPILESESGLVAGRDFGLSFMPETVYEGQTLQDLRTLPRIVGGITERCAQAAANFFSIFPAPVHVYDSPSVVEAAKLFMNVYRDTNIALVNELAMICERLDVDVTTAINAANVERKTHLLMPGLVGGYCLPKDSYYLAYPAGKAGYSPRLIMVARELNRVMPDHMLRLLDDAFEEMGVSVVGEKVAVLGLGFKANNGSLRSTQAVPIVRGLEERGAFVVAYDPFVSLDEVAQVLPGLRCMGRVEEALDGARCAVIVTDHSLFRRLSVEYMRKLMREPCAIIDARHIISQREAVSEGVVFRGLGNPVLHTRSFKGNE